MLSKIFEGVFEGCSAAREHHRQLNYSGDSADHQSLRNIASDERWSFFGKNEGASAPDASDDSLSNASTHSNEVEQRFRPCSRPYRDRASKTKRVSWNYVLCGEAGRKTENDRDPAAPPSAEPKDGTVGSCVPQVTCCGPPAAPAPKSILKLR